MKSLELCLGLWVFTRKTKITEGIYDCQETRSFQACVFHCYSCGYIPFSHLVPFFLLQASVSFCWFCFWKLLDLTSFSQCWMRTRWGQQTQLVSGTVVRLVHSQCKNRMELAFLSRGTLPLCSPDEAKVQMRIFQIPLQLDHKHQSKVVQIRHLHLWRGIRKLREHGNFPEPLLEKAKSGQRSGAITSIKDSEQARQELLAIESVLRRSTTWPRWSPLKSIISGGILDCISYNSTLWSLRCSVNHKIHVNTVLFSPDFVGISFYFLQIRIGMPRKYHKWVTPAENGWRPIGRGLPPQSHVLNRVWGGPCDVRHLTSNRKINPRIFWQKVPLLDV